MKKTYARMTAALTASFTVLSMCHAFPASAAETIRLTGDFDGDLKVTATDAQKTLELYAESIVGNVDNTATEDNSNIDIDMNGEIDVLDAQSILLYYCQTLVGNQPLWAEFREVSYHDGMDYMIQTGTKDDGFSRTPNDEQFEMTGLYIEIGCAQGAPGETVNVPVYIAGAPDLGNGVMFIDPPDGLKPTAITSGLTGDFELGDPSITEDSWLANGDNCVCGAYLQKGSFVFGLGSLYEIVHLPSDGYVIANYSYQIPEDAQSGTVYPVCLNAAKTVFTARLELADGSNEKTIVSKDYQYTLLNGVVVVE